MVRLGDSQLPERKHLFSIVNSQNNERVFFADLVVLVEGISDRIFFEALLKHFNLGEGSGKVYEVVSVGGKTIFNQYEKLLRACQVPYVVIADLDYIRQVGNDNLKALFVVSGQALKEKVIDDTTSTDGASLLAHMDEAISSLAVERDSLRPFRAALVSAELGTSRRRSPTSFRRRRSSLRTPALTGRRLIRATESLEDLRSLWEYVKSRQTRLKTDLTDVEQQAVDTFIFGERKERRFILAKGSLEAYLPVGFKGKDLEKLIRLLSDESFWEQLPTEGKLELGEIIKSINQFMLENDGAV